mmetsp:Transcript_11074/g.18538  ORF Transcript_11074/g.18538 Transcript_11074/m.18538 type:complete len:310 (+) Transcript_11074:870-1799(+)
MLFAGNVFSTSIRVTESSLEFEFDPRHLGLMSEKAQLLLEAIYHPRSSGKAEEVDYSFTMDQNLLNQMFVEFDERTSILPSSVSLREMLFLFDQKAQWIQMLSTSFLQLALPSLASEFGGVSQIDVVWMVDQDKFLHVNKRSPISGFSIDEHGHIQGNLNLISLLKLADPSLSLRSLRRKIKSDDFDDLDSLFESQNKAILMEFIDSSDWEVARTIFTTLSFKGRVVIQKKGRGKNELLVEITGVEISKLDTYRGDMTSSLQVDDLKKKLLEERKIIQSQKERVGDEGEDFDDDDEEDDEEDEAQKMRT